MNVGEIMKNIRKRQGISADVLAEAIGVSRSTIFRYEKGDIEKLPIEIVSRVAKALNVPLAELMGISKNSLNENISNIVSELNTNRQKNVYNYAKKQLQEQNNNRNVIKFPKDDDTLEISASGVLSAGVGEFLDDSTKPFTVTVHKPVPSNYDYAFQINGHSMEPVYQDKQVVFVKKEDDYRDGQIIAAVMNGCAYLKKLSVVDGEATLVSLNPDYPNIKVDKENGVKVLGVVFS